MKIIEIKEDIQIGDIILEKGDKIKVIEATSSTKVYPVFNGGGFTLYLDNEGKGKDRGKGYTIQGQDSNKIANRLKSIFGDNISVSEVVKALDKKGNGVSFEVFRSKDIVIKSLEKIGE